MSGTVITLPSFGDVRWKSPVASAASLPASGNTICDARIVQDSLSIYVWNGTAWILEVAPGATPPGGANTQVQYNHLGAFAGDSGMVYNSSTHALTLTGALSGSNLSGTNTGDLTLAAFGSTPAASGASLSGQALSLQPADGTHPGAIKASGAQSIGADLTAPTLTSTGAFSALSNQFRVFDSFGNSTMQFDDGTNVLLYTQGFIALGQSGVGFFTHLYNDGSAQFAAQSATIDAEGQMVLTSSSDYKTPLSIEASPTQSANIFAIGNGPGAQNYLSVQSSGRWNFSNPSFGGFVQVSIDPNAVDTNSPILWDSYHNHWAINGDGGGQLADSNINWDASGNINLYSAVQIGTSYRGANDFFQGYAGNDDDYQMVSAYYGWGVTYRGAANFASVSGEGSALTLPHLTASYWATAIPASLNEAIERIAAVVSNGGLTPIP